MVNRSRLVASLRQITDVGSMDKTSFARIHPNDKEAPYPTDEKTADVFIKARIRLWLDTWVVRPVGQMIRELEEL